MKDIRRNREKERGIQESSRGCLSSLAIYQGTIGHGRPSYRNSQCFVLIPAHLGIETRKASLKPNLQILALQGKTLDRFSCWTTSIAVRKRLGRLDHIPAEEVALKGMSVGQVARSKARHPEVLIALFCLLRLRLLSLGRNGRLHICLV
jgi:hypothetical protein